MAYPAKTIFFALIGIAATMIAGAADAQDRNSEPPFVAVLITSNNAETQAIVDGMRDQLAARGRWPGETVRIEVVETGANARRAEDLARAFARENAAALVAIGEPSISAAVNTSIRTPLVVADISLEAAEGYKRERRRRNVTGIVSGATHGDQFALIRQLMPDVETVAVPIDPVDGNIQKRLETVRLAARQSDMNVMALPVSVVQNAVSNRIAELEPATSAILLDRALLPDAPVEALAAAAAQRELPLFADDEDSVIRGALAAMIVEPFGIGEQLGDLVARIFDEPAATRAPFERARASHLVLNQDARARFDATALENEIASARRSVVDWADIAGPRPRIKPSVPEPPPPLGVARGVTVPTPLPRPSPPPG